MAFNTFAFVFPFRAEKEEAQLSNGNGSANGTAAVAVQQQQQVDPKPALTKRTAPIAQTIVRNNPTPPTRYYQTTTFNPLNQNKKSLVVNGNGKSSVRTSISREIIERNGLHL